MKIMAHMSRWSKMVLIRIGAGLTLGLIASSFLVVNGRDTNGVALPRPPLALGTAGDVAECDRLQNTNCASIAKAAVLNGLSPEDYTKNAVASDKPDDGAYFTEASYAPKFDPCRHWDGREYSGPGTVINPHADYTGCMPGAVVATTSDLMISPPGELSFAGGGDAAGSVESYLDPFGPGSPFWGPLPTGGIPLAQVITGTPTIPPTNGGDPFDPGADPVPLPAPALLFLTGLAGVIAARRKGRDNSSAH